MTVDIYPDIVKQNELSPEHFGSEIDDLCEQVKSATDGWGANKQQTIDALSTKDATIRTQMYLRYKELYDKDLSDLMRKEFSGDFGTALQFLALPLDKAECAMLRKATAGIGASAMTIASIVVGRTNDEIVHLKKTYFSEYGRDLGKLLASELHGDMENLVFNCLQGAEEPFDPKYHTAEKAAEDAEEIYNMGQGRWGTDEKGIFKIICSSPPEHVKNINQSYADKYGYTLEKAMEKELGGLLEKRVRKAMIHLVNMKLKPFEAMAAMIKAACAGIGTDELLLTCCIIRYQRLLPAVQEAHIEAYEKTIHDRVRYETSGHYKTVLLNTLNVTWPEPGMQ